MGRKGGWFKRMSQLQEKNNRASQEKGRGEKDRHIGQVIDGKVLVSEEKETASKIRL